LKVSHGLNHLFRLAVLLVVSGLNVACVESEFDLAEESRLPVWFKVPDGASRADVKLSLAYYTGGKAKFVLRNKSGRLISKASGELRTGLRKVRDSNSRDHLVDVVTVRGVAEVLEFSHIEPLFDVCDNPEVRRNFDVPLYDESNAPR
jgi:hypothetical protein